MPISHAHRCIFIHIPKTGGTSIETALGMFYSWKEENTDAWFGKIQSPHWQAQGWLTHYLQHLSWTELSQVAPPETLAHYASFSWVRNPWDRMVSIYSNKDPDMLAHANANGLKLKDLSFADFIDATEDYQHVHLRPQHQFILDSQNKPQVNFIGRYENIAHDFAKITQKLNINAALPHKNASTHPHYHNYYNDHSRKRIATRYQQDIDAFQYRY